MPDKHDGKLIFAPWHVSHDQLVSSDQEAVTLTLSYTKFDRKIATLTTAMWQAMWQTF